MSCQRSSVTTRNQRSESTSSQTRLRRFVFTLNNYTLDEYNWLTTTWAGQVTWLVIGKETSSTGTQHLQGACVIGKQMAFSTLKKLPGFARSHIEPMYGTPQCSLVYCTKEDKNAFLSGEIPMQGKRNDLLPTIERLQKGESLRDIATDGDGALALLKYSRGMTFLRSIYLKQRSQQPFVLWLSGKTGVGKTKLAFELSSLFASDICDDIWISSGGLQWFDGYDGQSIAIFDDFRAKHAKDFSFLLRITDRYPIRVPYKGGFVQWIPKLIIFTCPKSPEITFSTRADHRPEDVNQFLRRLSHKCNFDEDDRGLDDGSRCRELYDLIVESRVFENRSESSDLQEQQETEENQSRSSAVLETQDLQ